MANTYFYLVEIYQESFARANKYLSTSIFLKYARDNIFARAIGKIPKGLSQFNAKSERLVNDAAVMGDYVAANALA